jgi:Fe-S cluster biogenesis protein NfuA
MAGYCEALLMENQDSTSACSIAGQWAKKNAEAIAPDWAPPVDLPINERVGQVFEKVINPDLARDGGSVELVGVDSDRVVQIRMKGSCQGCASSAIRLSMILEATVKKYVPEVRFLEVVV